MTQIIEYTKHLDNLLIHHFNFECNDRGAISKFTGNCSLNKFMSLYDWQMILDYLTEPIENYVKNPSIKPMPVTRQLINTNFELHVTWVDLDASFYSKLLEFLDFNSVFPFVVKVKICLQSNIDKFATISLSPARNSIVKHDKTIDDSVVTNDASDDQIKLKDCFVRLPILQFDENGEVIQNDGTSNKRKHSSLLADKKYPLKRSPRQSDDPNELFMCSTSSTPFMKAPFNVTFKQIENDVRGTFAKKHVKTIKRLTNRLTTTPRTSNDRKTGSHFHPRIRLLKLPDNINSPKKLKKKKIVKVKGATTKRPKAKAQSIANESELFEVPPEVPKPIRNKAKKDTQLAETTKKKSEDKSPPQIDDIVKVEETDLKSLTEDELWQTFDEHHEIMSNLFHGYLKQTDVSVQKAGDYNHFDMISLLSTDQFSTMLDILFDKFVKIGEFGEISYDALFLELLIPEWVLAIYMHRNSLDRESAIEKISANKSKQNQSYDAYATLITIKLDETVDTSKI